MSHAWYALRVQAEREEQVKASLLAKLRAAGHEDDVLQIVVPAENVSEVSGGKRRVSQQKMFPGYMLVCVRLNENGEVPDGVWFAVQEASGVSGFVGGNRLKPEQLDEEEVKRIIDDMEARKGKPKPKIEFETGDHVRIKEGPFENFEGVVETVDPIKWVLKVKVSIFGRDTSVEMEYGKVEKV
jgi:transcriptional antiterminator NusG